MAHDLMKILKLVQDDQRYAAEAYLFVREALAFTADNRELDCSCHSAQHAGSAATAPKKKSRTSHISGQQLCEGLRLYAIMQFGLMAKIVLNSWGIYSTADFGNIVFSLIRAKVLKKSSKDRLAHFNEVYDFDEAFENQFDFATSAAQMRS